MYVDWLFWYFIGLTYYIFDTLLNRPIFLVRASSIQIVYYTLAFPHFYAKFWLSDDETQEAVCKAWTKLACAVLIVATLITMDGCLRLHAVEHYQTYGTKTVEGETDLLFANPEVLYLDHVSPLNDTNLPIRHRCEHRCMRVIYSAAKVDLGSNRTFNYNAYKRLEKFGLVNNDVYRITTLGYVAPIALLALLIKLYIAAKTIRRHLKVHTNDSEEKDHRPKQLL